MQALRLQSMCMPSSHGSHQTIPIHFISEYSLTSHATNYPQQTKYLQNTSYICTVLQINLSLCRQSEKQLMNTERPLLIAAFIKTQLFSLKLAFTLKEGVYIYIEREIYSKPLQWQKSYLFFILNSSYSTKGFKNQ